MNRPMLRHFSVRFGLRFPVALIVLLLLAPVPFACGPEPMRLVFTGIVHPDAPLENYYQGQLGVLQPTYARAYLFVAYRYLAGAPLTPGEQQAVAGHWNNPSPILPLPTDATGRITSWLAKWSEARMKTYAAAGGPQKPSRSLSVGDEYRVGAGYWTFLNCPEDAFRNAAAVLEARVAHFGIQSPQVQEWLKAQDAVFANCNGRDPAQIPPPAEGGWDPALRADRAYQIAAAHFYAMRFEEAAQRFDEIARDAASPWKALAPYLAARAFTRKATLQQGQGALEEAERRLRAILADPQQKEMHRPAQRQLNFVMIRLRPQERRKELVALLLAPQANEDKAQALVDYTRIMDNAAGDSGPFLNPAERAAQRARFLGEESVLRNEEMTDWILTFQASTPEARDHAIARWKETKSTPWLVAAVGKVDAKHPDAAALRGAAEKIAAGSAGFATAAFHAVRLQIEAGQLNEARARLDVLLAASATQNPSAQNLLRAARMRVARDVNELALFAPRSARSGFEYEVVATADALPQFDADFVAVFNKQTPLAKMVELIESKKLPEHLHRSAVLAAWTRAVLLGKHEVALSLAGEAERVSPAMKFVLRDYRAAGTAETRRYIAAYAMLSFPPLTPYVWVGPERKQAAELPREMDHRLDNWWCKTADAVPVYGSPFNGYRAGYEWESQALQTLYSSGKVEAPPFLDAAILSAAEKENQELAAVPTAPNYLAAVAVEWAAAQPGNPLVPEALHLAVMASRWGCTDDETVKFSKAAFEVLHRNYPQSDWAKKTKYYYGSRF